MKYNFSIQELNPTRLVFRTSTNAESALVIRAFSQLFAHKNPYWVDIQHEQSLEPPSRSSKTPEMVFTYKVNLQFKDPAEVCLFRMLFSEISVD